MKRKTFIGQQFNYPLGTKVRILGTEFVGTIEKYSIAGVYAYVKYEVRGKVAYGFYHVLTELQVV